MTDCTPLETLTLARDYLDALLADSSPEVQDNWLVQSVDKCTCAFTPEFGHEPYCGYEPLTNDPLIVALHATAPAIRAQISDAIHIQPGIGKPPYQLQDLAALRLAEALLSTSHAKEWVKKRKAMR